MKNIKELWRMSAHITAVAVVVLTGFISSGCGTKTVVVLLPEINGSAGEVIVTAQKSSEVLDQPYESAHVKASGQVVKKTELLVQNRFKKPLERRWLFSLCRPWFSCSILKVEERS